MARRPARRGNRGDCARDRNGHRARDRATACRSRATCRGLPSSCARDRRQRCGCCRRRRRGLALRPVARRGRKRDQRRGAAVCEHERRPGPGLFFRRPVRGTARDARAQRRPPGHGRGLVAPVPRPRGGRRKHRGQARRRLPGRRQGAPRRRGGARDGGHHRRRNRLQPLVAGFRAGTQQHLRRAERDRDLGRARAHEPLRAQGWRSGRGRRVDRGRDPEPRGLRRVPARPRAVRPERRRGLRAGGARAVRRGDCGRRRATPRRMPRAHAR